ncbi:MAG: N-acetylmuramoyl-L-alanine amidase, partial [Terracidiphilus sp.]
MRWSKTGYGPVLLRSLSIILAAAWPAHLSAQTPPAPASRFVVVIDAAHGGDDAGGRLASGRLEKDATLTFSVRLRSLLSARGIVVATTRESDVTLTPDQRAEIVNHMHAQACLS